MCLLLSIGGGAVVGNGRKHTDLPDTDSHLRGVKHNTDIQKQALRRVLRSCSRSRQIFVN